MNGLGRWRSAHAANIGGLGGGPGVICVWWWVSVRACVLGCLCQCVNACLCVGVGVLPFPFVLLSVRSRFAKVGFS